MNKEAALKIVVCVKQTPDTAATVSVQDGKVTWGEAALVINPWDEYAVEEALKIREAEGGTVTALSLGPEDAREALKHALAMGCDEAVLISDPAFAGLDSLGVSKVLAEGIKKLGDVDLVFFGRASVDSDTGITGSQVARRLAWPALEPGRENRRVGGGRKENHRRANAGRRSAAGLGCVSGRGQRREGNQRTALPLVHGDPESVKGRDTRLGKHGSWPWGSSRAGAGLA